MKDNYNCVARERVRSVITSRMSWPRLVDRSSTFAGDCEEILGESLFYINAAMGYSQPSAHPYRIRIIGHSHMMLWPAKRRVVFRENGEEIRVADFQGSSMRRYDSAHDNFKALVAMA